MGGAVGVAIAAIDPLPQPALEELAGRTPTSS